MLGIFVFVILGAFVLVAAAITLGVIALMRTDRCEGQIRSLRRDLTALQERTAQAAGRPISFEAQSEREASSSTAPRPARKSALARPSETAPPEAQAVPPTPRPLTPPTSLLSIKPLRRPVPPAPPTMTPPAPPMPHPRNERPFALEKLIGIWGAAALGAVAFIIAGLLFAKWAIDADLLKPFVRVVLLLLGGLAALVGAELILRRGYSITANALSGAGIAVLYAGFFVAYAPYRLVPLGVTFACMALVTVTACVLAVRHDSAFIAVLGLLGGFATPIVLSTGHDRPIALFSYIMLLDVGLIAIALRRRWWSLIPLSLAGTLVIELGWFGRFMAPEKLLIALIVFSSFGFLYLLAPAIASEESSSLARSSGVIGGMAPLLFGLLLAGDAAYAADWPLLFGFIAVIAVGLTWVALKRGSMWLHSAAALATGLFLPLWALGGLTEARAWAASVAASALVLITALPIWILRMGHRHRNETGGMLASVGLGFWTFILVARGLGEPPGPCMLLFAVLTFLAAMQLRAWPYLGVVGFGMLAILVQTWFFASTAAETLSRNVALPLLLILTALLLAVWASRSKGAQERHQSQTALGFDLAAMLCAIISVAGLHGVLLFPSLARAPAQLFAALAILMLLGLALMARRRLASVAVVELVVVAVFSSLWHLTYYQSSDFTITFPFLAGAILLFLGLPFLSVLQRIPRARQAAGLWFASALSGPLLFWPLYRAVTRSLGDDFIGALPIALGIGAVMGLVGVGRVFSRESIAQHLRLRYLALFAAVALWFVALAIPLQLSRQWITIGWAVEGAALFWLLRRLPHPGLRLFGTTLFAVIGIRLLLNPSVLEYEERALPVLNWLLYTYGVPALCCFAGAAWLRQASSSKSAITERLLPGAVAMLGLLLVFWLINLEVFDYFSEGDRLSVDWTRRYARDLALSIAWGLYGLALLLVGITRRMRALRIVALAFLALASAKVFLYDLASLAGLYRVLSFLGLAVALLIVSLLYQRFVLFREGSR